MRIIIIFLFSLAPAFCQTVNVTKVQSGNAITGDLSFPSGRTLTVLTGGFISFPSNSLNWAALSSTNSPSTNYIPVWNGTNVTWQLKSTVSSVGITAPAIFTVTGSPITSSGNIALSYSGTALPVANGGTGLTASTGTLPAFNGSALTNLTYANITGTPTSLPPSGSASGDLSGSYPSPTVVSGAHLASTTVPNNALQATITSNTSGTAAGLSTTLVAASGGTGQTSISAAFNSFFESVANTLGDLVYGGASGAPIRLAGSTSASEAILTQTGNGTVSAAPVWSTAPTFSGTNITTLNASNLSSGTVPAARLPNPSASTLGGIESYVAVTNQWINSISTSGVPSSTQPAFSNLSGSLASGQMPALTGDVTSTAGTVATTVGKINGTSLAGLSTGILKNTTTTGVPSIATSGTDYAPPTSGSSILYGNGSGGFNNVTIGSGLSFTTGTLTATSGSGTVTSVGVSGGTFISSSGGPITTSGNITLGLSASGTASSSTFLRGDNTWAAPSGSGTVTSVGATTTYPGLTVGGSPITSSGNITFTPTSGLTANQFIGTPNGTTGVVALRSIVAADIPTLNQNTSGSAGSLSATLAIASGGTGQTSAGNAFNALSPMTTLGDTIYGNTSGAGTRLAGSTSATKQFLTQTGNGTISAVPTWGTIATGDVPTLNQNTSGTASGLSSTLVGASGGTGIANTGKTITLGGNLTTAGSFTTTLTSTANTSITLPTSGTLLTTTGSAAGLTAIPGGNITSATIASSSLVASGVTSGTYGDSTHSPQIAINSQGQVTSASNVVISGAPTTGTLAALGTSQSGASNITSSYTIISSSNSSNTGVQLPTGASNLFYQISNPTSQFVNVYPKSGGSAQINSLGTNASYILPPGGASTFVGLSSTQWNTSTNSSSAIGYCEYNGNAGQGLTGSTTNIEYTSLVLDPYGLYATGTGVFTAPYAGVANISAGCNFNSSQAGHIDLYVNSSLRYQGFSSGANVSVQYQANFQAFVNSGDTIEIRHTASGTLSTDTTGNYMSIKITPY